MNFWITFWSGLLIASVAVFAVLAIAVTIGGFFDVRSLLRSIDAQHAESKDNDQGDA